MGARKISVDEISQHSSPEDCWIVVDGAVWDLTHFAPDHPGGAHIITQHAGHDASAAYNTVHDASLLAATLAPADYKGQLDPSTVTSKWSNPQSNTISTPKTKDKPPLSTILNAQDFESAAAHTVSQKTWAFYSSAATDCVTRERNVSFFSRIWLRPRVLCDVSGDVDMCTSMLGQRLDVPLYVAPAALAKLIHPEGEKALARGCMKTRIAQVISTNASFPVEAITASSPATPFFFQLYVNKSRSATEQLLSTIQSTTSISALWVTVDAPVPGKREADERVRADTSIGTPISGQQATNDSRGGGLGRTMGSYIDASLSWSDIPWLRSIWHGRIVLKGIQSAADAERAVAAGVDGIVVSNHGGRSLDTVAPAVMVLLELRLRCPRVFDKIEVYVDSGIRRGADVVKCLCLGAKAVGMGRPFLYALNYGEEGVEKLVEVMRDEMETTMRLLGVTSVKQLHPGLLNYRDVEHLVPEGRRWRWLSARL